MADTIEDLLDGNLRRVFNERDDERRRAAVAELYTEDVEFTDPEETVRGRADLDEKARSLLAASPGFVFTPLGEPRPTPDGGALDWGFGPAAEGPVATGTDTIVVRDGRIAVVTTVLHAD